MLFNSLQFVGFFFIVTTFYFLLPWRWQWKMLLVASCLFYMAFVPAYILVLFATILIDYLLALKIAVATGRRRRTYLQVSVLATCLVLFAFKYYDFFASSGRALQLALGLPQTFPLANIVLPIGLSFHTFQSLSYVIEVYRGRQQPERNFGIYALYVMFYPQLVAGPIERPQNLLHQFYAKHTFDSENVSQGVQQIAWGFFQKMVVADRAAAYVNSVYVHWESASGLSLIVATLLFAVQIYADFAGYSNIAIGAARVMGFTLMKNFDHPYFASSVSEFWKRWHISLSTWFKDYVYISLGGSRVSLPRHYVNLVITFALSGLWHGANWTFVVWGLYNGILLVLENGFAAIGGRWPRGALFVGARRLVTLLAVCAGWILFRAPDSGAAKGIALKIATATSLSMASVQEAVLVTTNDNTALAVLSTTIGLIILMFAAERVSESNAFRLTERLRASPRYQALVTVSLFQLIMLFGVLRASTFIYFQF